jgi:hypothetical protein
MPTKPTLWTIEEGDKQSGKRKLYLYNLKPHNGGLERRKAPNSKAPFPSVQGAACNEPRKIRVSGEV